LLTRDTKIHMPAGLMELIAGAAISFGRLSGGNDDQLA
jgi:hypothetical protein